MKIKDSALVAAAELSHRYITDRFLPDKAIDLMDEATSRLAMELESVPAEIDEVQRRLTQLELAARQLAEETEEHAKERLAEIEEEMATLRKQLADLREQWESEKLGVGDVQKFASSLQQAEHQFEQLAAAIKEKQASGVPVRERGHYQSLYELDTKRRKLERQLDEMEQRQAAAAETDGTKADAGCCGRKSAPDEIAEVVSAWTGIPVSRMMETERAKLLVLEERLHQRVVGQDEAVEAVANAVRRSRSGLQDPHRPIGSFLFLRPHGRGQDRAVQGAGRGAVRRRARHGAARHERVHGEAHGQPPDRRAAGLRRLRGRRQADRSGAPPAVLRRAAGRNREGPSATCSTSCLQVLDDGRLTDNHGHTVDFTNTIVVMTSNIGSQLIQQIADEGGSEEEMREAVQEALKARFLPEFLNRIDETIVFHPLNREQVAKIVDLQFARLEMMVAKNGLHLEVTPAARNRIAALGYDPSFGARPVKRVIQQEIQNPLATELLKGEYPEGSTIVVDVERDEFTFAKSGESAAMAGSR